MDHWDGSVGAVVTEVVDGVGTISLNRPRRLNALTFQVMVELREALQRLGGRSDVRAVVLTGAGRAFCAGLDLDQGLEDPNENDPVEAMNSGMRVGLDIVWAMRTIPQPVIVAVQGHAVGAGFSFAAAADVRFIGPGAVFSAPFLSIGMTAGDLGLSWFLPRIIGQGRASELFYSSGSLDAQAAVDSGFVSRISADPLADALAFAEQIVRFPPYGVTESKSLMNAGATTSLHDHLESEARAQVVGYATRRAREAMAQRLASTKDPAVT